MQVIYVVGVLKKRLAIPRHSPQVLRMLITACWQDDADLRPNFLTVFPLLQVQSIQSLLCLIPYTDIATSPLS